MKLFSFFSMLSLALALYPASSFAAKYAVLAGGCMMDPDPYSPVSDNAFAAPFAHWAIGLNNRGWKMATLFSDGSVTALTDLTTFGWPKTLEAPKPFTWDNFTADLASEGFNVGDQLLVVVVTHGSPGATHGWCVDNKVHSVSEMVPLLKNLTATKHLKIGVVDDSCFGGNAIDELAGTGACTLSFSGRLTSDSPEFASNITAQFAGNFAPGDPVQSGEVISTEADGAVSMMDLLVAAQKLQYDFTATLAGNDYVMYFPTMTGDSPFGEKMEQQINGLASTADVISAIKPVPTGNFSNIQAALSHVGYNESAISRGFTFLSDPQAPLMPKPSTDPSQPGVFWPDTSNSQWLLDESVAATIELLAADASSGADQCAQFEFLKRLLTA